MSWSIHTPQPKPVPLMRPTATYNISPEVYFEGFCRFLIASIQLSERGQP